MTETARLVIAVDSTQAKQADAALANLGKTSSAVEKNVGALTGALTRVAAPLAAFISTRAVIDAADQYGQMASRMKMATSFHAGGLRLVGENGPELEVTGPSRIYNASQTAAMLGGGGDAAAEVRGLRADFGGMMSALRSVAKHTMQTAKRVEFLERWDFDGLPKERATA